MVALRHIEHHRLEISYHVGAIGEDAVGFALVERGTLVVLAGQFLGKFQSLRALDESACRGKTVEIGLEILCKLIVVDAEDGK